MTNDEHDCALIKEALAQVRNECAAEKARADEAEADCAAMRAVLEEIRSGKDRPFEVVRALATDSGRRLLEEHAARVLALENALATAEKQARIDARRDAEIIAVKDAEIEHLSAALRRMQWCRSCAEGSWSDCRDGRNAEVALGLRPASERTP